MIYIEKIYRSPIHYPGGKHWIVEDLLSYIHNDIDEMVEPFFGGGVVGWNMAVRDVEVYGYDIDKALVNFWQYWIANSYDVIEVSKGILEVCDKEQLKARHHHIYNGDIYAAALYFLYTRLSGYGLFGKMSILRDYAYNKDRGEFVSYIKDAPRSIFDLPNIAPNNYNLSVQHGHFYDVLETHKDMFAFCDPPYIKTEDVYNDIKPINNGDLYDLLDARDNWILTYGESKLVRSLYENYHIKTILRTSGMRARSQKNTIGGRMKIPELIVFSHDIAETVKSQPEQLALFENNKSYFDLLDI